VSRFRLVEWILIAHFDFSVKRVVVMSPSNQAPLGSFAKGAAGVMG
jgi:hypothetical protein